MSKYSKEIIAEQREWMCEWERNKDSLMETEEFVGLLADALNEIERLQSVCDQNVSEIELLRNRIAELEERLDIDYGNMYDVIVAENERLIKESKSLKEKNG